MISQTMSTPTMTISRGAEDHSRQARNPDPPVQQEPHNRDEYQVDDEPVNAEGGVGAEEGAEGSAHDQVEAAHRDGLRHQHAPAGHEPVARPDRPAGPGHVVAGGRQHPRELSDAERDGHDPDEAQQRGQRQRGTRVLHSHGQREDQGKRGGDVRHGLEQDGAETHLARLQAHAFFDVHRRPRQ